MCASNIRSNRREGYRDRSFMLRESLRTRVSLMNLLSAIDFSVKPVDHYENRSCQQQAFSNDKIRHRAASPGLVHTYTRFTQFAKYSRVIYESLFPSFFPVYLSEKRKKRKKFTWYIRLFCNVRTNASKNRRGNFMR